jgi:transposase InsO family protein
MEEWGIMKPSRYVIHDQDGKFCPAFKKIIDDAGVNRVPLPPRSPHLNGFTERWVKSVKEEALSRMILFGERSLWHVLNEYVAHYHEVSYLTIQEIQRRCHAMSVLKAEFGVGDQSVQRRQDAMARHVVGGLKHPFQLTENDVTDEHGFVPLGGLRY